MRLYPQLPRPAAEQIVSGCRRMLIDDPELEAAIDHPDVVYTATGGSRVTETDLQTLREAVVGIARSNGFPGHASDHEKAVFDRDAAVLLHGTMDLSANEASRPGVWDFVGCVLLRDVVRWRFPGEDEGTAPERFLAGRRNAFQRLWWRAFVLHQQGGDSPYELVTALGEDELVQIMERPFLAGSSNLARAVARQLLSVAATVPEVSRRTLIREGQKHLRRLAAFTSFDSLDADSLDALVKGVFEGVAQTAIRNRVHARA